MSDPRPKSRVDKWLWHARFFKTRGLATKQVSAGHVQVNGDKIGKPAYGVGPGDTLTFLQARDVRVVRILELASRRGPAPEAQALYEDLTPEREFVPPAPKFEGKGRPSRKDRRNSRLSRFSPLE